MKPQKIEIDFNTTAGNFYIKDALGYGYPPIDPNSDFGKAVVERYNSYEEMQQRIAQLEEALKELLIILESSNNISNGYTLFITNDDSKKIEKAKSLLK